MLGDALGYSAAAKKSGGFWGGIKNAQAADWVPGTFSGVPLKTERQAVYERRMGKDDAEKYARQDANAVGIAIPVAAAIIASGGTAAAPAAAPATAAPAATVGVEAAATPAAAPATEGFDYSKLMSSGSKSSGSNNQQTDFSEQAKIQRELEQQRILNLQREGQEDYLRKHTFN
jgi:hypothetical protein